MDFLNPFASKEVQESDTTTPKISGGRRSSKLSSALLKDALKGQKSPSGQHKRVISDFELVGDDHLHNLEEEAETTLVKVLEARKRRASFTAPDLTAKGFKPAVEGETPLIPEIPSLSSNLFPQKRSGSTSSSASVNHHKLRLKDVANRVKEMQKTGVYPKSGGDQDSTRKQPRPSARIQNIIDQMKEASTGRESTDSKRREPFASTHDEIPGSTEKMMRGAQTVNDLLQNEKGQNQEGSEIVTNVGGRSMFERSEELLPLTSDKPSYGTQEPSSDGGSAVGARRKRWKLIPNNSAVAELLSCGAIAKRFLKFVSVMLGICLPLVVLAGVFYYELGNPEWDVLPGHAPFSWWLLFAARLVFTLEIAEHTQYILVDVLALRTRYVANFFGPLLTLWIIQSRGWPCTISFWSLYNLILLHGDNSFQRNWLHWTDVELFSDANPGAELLASEFYLRILVSMLVVGLAHTVKSTYLATSFGKRLLLTYRGRLEKILADLVLVTEVVDLMTELQAAYDAGVNMEDVAEDTAAGVSPFQIARTKPAKWGSLEFNKNKKTTGINESLMDEEELDALAEKEENDPTLMASAGADAADDIMSTDHEEYRDAYSELPTTEDFVREGSSSDLMARIDLRSTYGSSADSLHVVKALLETWEEPVSKLDQKDQASIGDMLKFRKAVEYMDDSFPFSLGFGPASNRDECIASARTTYYRLLELTDNEVLSFKVLQMVAMDENGIMDDIKKKKLKRLFRPDLYNEVSLIGFVQTCDSLYKRLRYFRASVGNSSVLNRVLGNIIDTVFNFILALIVLALLNFNPWPLLVSLSTLLVTFAFAVGTSASRYIEGVLTIAARRPFDLGDRVMILRPDDMNNYDFAKYSFFVEDINLYSTTLRRGSTNAISTLLNGDIAKYRVVNCARSTNAVVYIDVKFQLEVDDQKLAIFRSAVLNFLKERPRTWVELRHFRCQGCNTDKKYVEYQIALQHARPWQEAPRIMLNRAELVKFCYKTGKYLEINYLGVVEQLEVVGSLPSDVPDYFGKRVADRRGLTFHPPLDSDSVLPKIPETQDEKST